jgi:hypothetical protein
VQSPCNPLIEDYTEIGALTCPAYNISAQTAQKAPFLCCCVIIAFVSIGIIV